ncbi:hypothetical protein N9F50_02080, partial [Akkermansiaceae bacterium]|nr:hypothetical protein [Akkermansiaceae bacterium]
TMGPLLGMFLCALIGKGSFRGILMGAVISFLITMLIRTDVWILLKSAGWENIYDLLVTLPSYEFDKDGVFKALFNSSWMWAIGTILTFAGGLIGASVESGEQD